MAGSGVSMSASILNQVLVEILLQQGLAELFLGLEVVVEGALGHARSRDDLGQADGRIAFLGHQRLGHIKDVLACFLCGFLHGIEV